MAKLIVLAVLVVIGWKMLVGRWPWESKQPRDGTARAKARALLGVGSMASRDEILAAHRRLVATVHPDRGGSSGAVHEANAARDLLLEQMPQDRDS